MIEIKRKAMDMKQFHRKNRKMSSKDLPFVDQINRLLIALSKRLDVMTLIRSVFPITEWLPEYKWPTDLVCDAIAGTTISVLHVPQGISNAFIAGLDPIYGLYLSFFPGLVYVFMGTSRHLSIGSFSLSSMMVSNIADQLEAIDTRNGTNDWPPTRLEVATSAALLSGLFQIGMGLLSLGRLSLLLSDELVSSFTTGAVIHIIVSQLDNVMGIDVERQPSGPLKLIRVKALHSTPDLNDSLTQNLNAIYKEWNRTNVWTLGMSLLLLVFLITFKDCVEKRIKTPVAIPIDFAVVVFATLISWIFEFDKTLDVDVIGELETGLPHPSVPRVDLFQYILIDCLIIALVSFAISFSLAKIIAKRQRYDVHANQELFALGSANAIASFFNSFPASAAISRSQLQERIGGRTQIATIFSCFVLLNIILFFASFLYHLPEFALSVILIVAVKDILRQFKDFWEFWFISKLCGISWLFTFLSVILWDIDIGLIIGIFFSLHLILFRLISPMSSTLGCLPSTEIYVDIDKYRNAEEIKGIKILRFCSPIFYLSNDTFKDEIFGITHTNKYDSEKNDPNKRPKILIIDMSCVGFMDKSGAEAVADAIEHLRDYKVVVCLVCCPVHVIDILVRSKFFDKFDHNYVFPTIQDAIVTFKDK